MADEVIKTCDECGAAVYPDHLESGQAGYVDDKLLCPISTANTRKALTSRTKRMSPSPWWTTRR